MGVYKRGGTWWMRFSVGGRQVRRTTGTRNKELAKKILDKVKTAIVEGHWFDITEEKDHTVAEMLERYEREHLSAQADQRKGKVRIKHLNSFFGTLTLDQVTPSLIAEFRTKRQAAGAAPATINRDLAAFKKAFNLAVKEWEWCRSNPVARIGMLKEPPGRDRYLSAAEEERLLAASPGWLREIVVFATNTGMRQGEIISLRLPSVDLFRRTATVEMSKNGEKRTVPLNQTVLKIVKTRLKVHALKTDLVFHREGRAIPAMTLIKRFEAVCEKAAISDFRFHDLRHTFATRLVHAGVDLYKVQRLLGHKTPIMTQRYAHHSTDSLRDGVERLAGGSTNLAQSDNASALLNRQPADIAQDARVVERQTQGT